MVLCARSTTVSFSPKLLQAPAASSASSRSFTASSAGSATSWASASSGFATTLRPGNSLCCRKLASLLFRPRKQQRELEGNDAARAGERGSGAAAKSRTRELRSSLFGSWLSQTSLSCIGAALALAVALVLQARLARGRRASCIETCAARWSKDGSPPSCSSFAPAQPLQQTAAAHPP